MALDGPSLPAQSGATKSLVIFLHGYGANGDDLIAIGNEWASVLPDTAFVSPHAQDEMPLHPGGREWFDLSVRSDESRWQGVNTAGPGLDAFITSQMDQHGLPASKVALVGFSQGTMMALHVGLRRGESLAGIVGYSGTIAGGEYLKAEIKSRPPVFLAHGTVDQVIPVDALVHTVEVLAESGVPRAWHVAHGMAHGIDRTGLVRGAQFLKQCFG